MDNFPRNNLTAKILALIFAIILWVYVMNEQNPPVDVALQVPLEVRNLAAGHVAADVVQTVRIKVRGPRNLVAAVGRDTNIKAYLDLSDVGEGRQTVKVHAAIPSGIEVAELTPDKITLRIDKIIARKVPVEARFTGTAPGGATVGKVVPGLNEVTVEGPRSMVDDVEKVIAHIDLTGQTGDFSAELPLVAIGRDGKTVEGLKITPSKVIVKTSLLQGANKKLADIKTIVTDELAPGFVLRSITTEPEKIEITGEPQLLSQIDFVYTEPISLNGIDKDTKKEIKLQLRSGITAAKNTVIAHITVEKK